ncbi:MAG: hypothetical protein KDJ29_16625, partial [Hyphomicrobiales bacterium]|nr:hypothetical protein [Hyphomicrobiales bacterium]
MGYDDNTPLKGVTGGGLPAEIWQAVMEEIHEGLPVESLGSFAFDASGAVPQVVNTGTDGAADPLADALSQALGQPSPQAPAPVDGQEQLQSPDAAPPMDATTGATTGTTAGTTTGGPPTFPAETVTSGDIIPTDPGAEDALTQALRGISGVYQE